MLRPCWLVLVLCGVVTAPLFAQEPPAEKVLQERTVVAIKTQPATAVTKILAKIFQPNPNVRMTASETNNLLVVDAPPDATQEILALVQELDATPAMVEVEVIAVEFDRQDPPIQLETGPTADVKRTVAELAKSQRLRVVDRLQLVALSNQEGVVQTGQSVPTPSGRQMMRGGPAGRGQVSYQYQDIGVVLRCLARVASDRSVAMDVDFDKSTLLPTSLPGELADEDAQPPMTILRTRMQTTVRLRPGECAVVGGLREAAGGTEDAEWRLIISADVRNQD